MQRLKLPTNRAFHLVAPYLAGLLAVLLSTAIGVSYNGIMAGALLISMALAIILWLLLVLRACRDIGLLAFATIPSAVLVILAGTMIPALFGACAFANQCI